MLLLRETLHTGSHRALSQLLHSQPELAHVYIDWGPEEKNHSHPLAYLCDLVFAGTIDEPQAYALAEVLIGAKTDPNLRLVEGEDTPLITACSLYTDELALRYLPLTSHVDHRGTHLGTALHWAAWTGAAKVVPALLARSQALNFRDNEFGSTPLGWALNGATQSNQPLHERDHRQVVHQLLEAGAAPNLPDASGHAPLALISPDDQPDLHDLLVAYGGKQ